MLSSVCHTRLVLRIFPTLLFCRGKMRGCVSNSRALILRPISEALPHCAVERESPPGIAVVFLHSGKIKFRCPLSFLDSIQGATVTLIMLFSTYY